MLKDYKKWMRLQKELTILEVYDLPNSRFFYRPLTIKEQHAILIMKKMKQKENELNE